MSVWVVVKCRCPDRKSLTGSSSGGYACGHEDGAAVSTSPNDLIGYGHDLERIYKHRPGMFELWRKIGSWRRFSHRGDLELQPDEAMMWQLEIEQLQRFLSGEEFMGWDEMQLWLKLREEVRLTYTRVGAEPPAVADVLAGGLALCRASQETGNPIEFQG